MAIMDLAYNPLSVAGSTAAMLGYLEPVAGAEELNLRIYDFIIKPHRDADQTREGKLFLQRMLEGPQAAWETIQSKIFALKNLWSVTDIDDEHLRYLQRIVGWTSDLDYITEQLDAATLRRLIAISVPMWKSRTTESSLVAIMNTLVPARARVLSWFDMRWILDTTIMSEEHRGRDPWLVSFPGGTGTDEFWSTIRVVDPGDETSKDLLIDVIKLVRPVGERYRVVWLKFLDQFTIDDDVSQWDISNGVPTVEGGSMSMIDTSIEEGIVCNVEGSDAWENYVVTSRVRGVGTGAGFGISFFVQSVSPRTFYYAVIDVPNQRVLLAKYISDALSVIKNWYAVPAGRFLQPGTWYGLRIQASPEGASTRIKIYLDAKEIINELDGDLDKGTVGVLHASGDSVECDEIEVLGLPVDSEEILINS
jgi:hypothetical protein